MCTVPINQRYKGWTLNMPGTWIILGRWTFPTRRQNTKELERKECQKYVALFQNQMADQTRKSYFQEAVDMAKNINKEEW